jgi:hypothetical protein
MATTDVKFAAKIDSKILATFLQQAKSRGFLKQRAATGAIQLWNSLPATTQVRIVAGELLTLKEILQTAAGTKTAQ